jgi:hypothetical protein
MDKQFKKQAHKQKQVKLSVAALRIHVTSQFRALFSNAIWSVTGPLRWTLQQIRLVRAHGFKKRLKALAKKVLRRPVLWLLTKPKLKSLATQFSYQLGVIETLKPFVRSLIASYQQGSNDQRSRQPQVGFNILSPRSSKIYNDLKRSIEKKRKGQF